MPTNPAIPTLATGNVLSATQWNYLTALNGGVGLLGAVGPLVGTLPPVSAPNFQIQAGRASITVTAANFSFSWPTAFPNGLLAAFIQSEAGAGQVDTIVLTATSTKTTAVAQFFRSGAPYTGAAGINFIAIGF